MELHDFRPVMGRPMPQHGSTGVTTRPVLRAGSGAVTVLHVAAGGEIGRHPAPADQVFTVLAGTGRVQGADGEWAEIGAGQAALWRTGEEHVTRALTDLTALVVELRA